MYAILILSLLLISSNLLLPCIRVTNLQSWLTVNLDIRLSTMITSTPQLFPVNCPCFPIIISNLSGPLLLTLKCFETFAGPVIKTFYVSYSEFLFVTLNSFPTRFSLSFSVRVHLSEKCFDESKERSC